MTLVARHHNGRVCFVRIAEQEECAPTVGDERPILKSLMKEATPRPMTISQARAMLAPAPAANAIDGGDDRFRSCNALDDGIVASAGWVGGEVRSDRRTSLQVLSGTECSGHFGDHTHSALPIVGTVVPVLTAGQGHLPVEAANDIRAVEGEGGDACFCSFSGSGHGL